MRVAEPKARLDGWLEIRGLRCVGRHGAYDGEQEIERAFLVDVAVRADPRQAAEADVLSATIDFAALAATVRAIIGGPPRVLLETVALEAARAVLHQFGAAEEVRVRVAKAEPPGLDAAEEAVKIALVR